MSEPTLAQRLIPAAAVALVLPVLVPCWVVALPRLYFDVDPRSEGADIVTTLGPAGFGWLACLGVLAAGLAVAVHVRAGGAVRWGSAALVLTGVAFTAWHAPARFENLWHGVGWVWGAAAGLAALHLGAWPDARRWAAALLAGLAAALAVDAVYYVYVEHPEMVRQFERNTADWLAARGWEAGSSEATLYERRVRTDDAIGALGLSNVLGTLAAGLAMLGAGVAWGGFNRRATAAVDLPAAVRERWAAWGCGLVVATAGVAVVKLTNSAGALGAVVLTAGWLVAAGLVMGRAERTGQEGGAGVGRWGRAVACSAVALPALVVLGVLVRGWVGVPSPEQVGQGLKGELSVLFRWQYWGAAGRMAADSWSNALVGVGPGGFGDLYLIHKDPLNPEEVTSAHNVFVDWIVMIGVGGWAWSAVLLWWLWSGARGLAVGPANDTATHASSADVVGGSGRVGGYAVLGLALLLFGGEAWVSRWEVLGTGLGAIGVRLLAGGAFVAVAVGWLSVSRGRSSGRAVRLGLVGAAVAVLTHAQFDMGFFQPPSAPVLWVVVGLCGAVSHRGRLTVRGAQAMRPEPEGTAVKLQLVSVFLAGFLLVAGMGMAATWCWRYEKATSLAAQSVRSGDFEDAQSALFDARHFGPFKMFDAVLLRERIRLQQEEAMVLERSGEFPLAHDAWQSIVRRLLNERIQTHFHTSRLAGISGENPAVWKVWATLEAELRRNDRPVARHAGTMRLLARSAERYLHVMEIVGIDLSHGDESERDLINLTEPSRIVAAAVEAVIDRSPFSVRDHVWLADVRARSGDARGASEAARVALELDAQRYLDPGKQLDEETRARMRSLVEAGASGTEDGADNEGDAAR